MQATTYMQPPKAISTRSRPSTADRILSAAARVYAREGIEGATTREIAREASVNEVTLFRHFKSKDKLLAAVVGRNFAAAGPATPIDIPSPTADLAHDLLELAKCYDRILTVNLPLVRAIVGEIHRHREHERQVFRWFFYPVRGALQTRLEAARKAGQLRRDADIEILGDLFSGMIFMGVLKRNTPNLHRNYGHAAYLQAVADMMLSGAATRQ